MTDDNVTPLFGRPSRGTTIDASPTPDQLARTFAVMDRLVEAGMAQWVGNGTDNVFLTPEGVAAFEVLIIIMQNGYPDFKESYLDDHGEEPNFHSVHQYAVWHLGEL